MHGELERLILGDKHGHLSESEKRVMKHHRERRTVSTNAHAEFIADASFGERIADRIAAVGGSWAFIIGFLVFLAFWVVLNTVLLVTRAFDPYPFIFLNLVLSMIAALQAPVIMMSQNRAAARDRFMAQKDYEVNLKAELEVLGLHEKIDRQVLTELRQMQTQIQLLTDELKEMRKG